MKFIPRTIAPSKTDKNYYSNNNAYYKNGYGMPNCTAYAYGRILELLGYIPTGLYYGNAENWYNNTKNLEKGQIPKLGAIACYRSGKTGDSSDGAGHVAIVEKVNGNSFECSNSAYKKTNFYMTKGYDTKNNKTFQGFIYLPVEFEENKENEEITINIKVGDKVKVLNSINYDTGKNFTLYYDEYDVIEIVNNRVVIGIGNIVTSAIDVKNIELIKKETTINIKVGNKVKVLNPINYDTGKKFTLYYDEYDVIEIVNNRVVIGIGNVITSAIDIKNIKRI